MKALNHSILATLLSIGVALSSEEGRTLLARDGLPGTLRVNSAIPAAPHSLSIGLNSQYEIDPTRFRYEGIDASAQSFHSSPSESTGPHEMYSMESFLYAQWTPISRLSTSFVMPLYADWMRSENMQKAALGLGDIEMKAQLYLWKAAFVSTAVQGGFGVPTGMNGGIAPKYNAYTANDRSESAFSAREFFYHVMGVATFAWEMPQGALNLHLNYGIRKTVGSQLPGIGSMMVLREAVEWRLASPFSIFTEYSHFENQLSVGLALMPSNGWNLTISAGTAANSKYAMRSVPQSNDLSGYSFKKSSQYSVGVALAWNFDYKKPPKFVEFPKEEPIVVTETVAEAVVAENPEPEIAEVDETPVIPEPKVIQIEGLVSGSVEGIHFDSHNRVKKSSYPVLDSLYREWNMRPVKMELSAACSESQSKALISQFVKRGVPASFMRVPPKMRNAPTTCNLKEVRIKVYELNKKDKTVLSIKKTKKRNKA